MGFIISNVPFENAAEFFGCFYESDEVIKENRMIGFLKTNEFGINKDKLISNIRFMLKEQITDKRVSEESFYLTAFYSKDDKKLYLQTDMIGSLPIYEYCSNGTTLFSDEVLRLIDTANKLGLPIGLIDEEVKKFVFAGSSLSEKTIFKNITIIPPATIKCISFADGCQTCNVYHSFKFKHKTKNEVEAAKSLYEVIDNVFHKHAEKKLLYGIGVSGGLDSRIAGYFAKKHKYNVIPFFLGREKNQFGVRTNDACRSLEVASVLGFTGVKFVNNTKFPYIDRLICDAMHAPLGSPNVAQNIGYEWRKFDVLLHGMMGGELFGGVGFLSQRDDARDPHMLALKYINSMCQLPKTTACYSLSGKVLSKTPYIKNFYEFKETNHIIDDITYERLVGQVEEFVKKEIDNDYTNTNILLKLFVYDRAKNVSGGYYSTLEGTVSSLGVYFNPSVLEEMLSWDDSMFYERKVQKELLMLCGNLSEVRDQTIKSSISEGYSNKQIPLKNLVERVVRGSGMYYDTFPIQSFDEALELLKTTDTVKLFPLKYKQLMLSKSYIVDCVLKIAWIEKKYRLTY